MPTKYEGIELVRYAKRLFSDCNETFNQKYTADQLLKIADACSQSRWDIYPDEWEERQIQEALCGIIPDWEEDGETPKYKECSLYPNNEHDKTLCPGCAHGSSS